MRITALTSLLSLFAFTTLYSQKPVSEVEYSTFLKEVQRTSLEGNFKMVWWIPGVTWQIISRQSPEFTPEMAESVEKALEDYVIVCASSADLGSGNVSNQSESSTERNLTITVNGKSYRCLDPDDISEEANVLKSTMEPVFANMMGNFGKGLRLYFFRVQDSNGKGLLDPYGNQAFSIKLFNQQFDWQLPLSCLMEDKVCPKDHVTFPANYLYCPFHGSELQEQQSALGIQSALQDTKADAGPRKIVNQPDVSTIHSDSDCYIALDLTINENGEVTDCAVNRRLTTTTDEAVIKQVIELVRKEVRYAARPGKKAEAVALKVHVSAN